MWCNSEVDWEHPLLVRLAGEAPGTFYHSVAVGLLAREAARVSGADARLAYLGGLYHDVGKVYSPYFFPENLGSRANPHVALDACDRAAILRRHVSDGVGLVLGHGLGERVAACVREHHGTMSMPHFEPLAKSQAAPSPPPDTYSYWGPRPGSREAAFIMIADQIESRSRSESTGATSFKRLAACTIESLQDQEQFADSGLGADLAVVADALARVLGAMDHRHEPLSVAGSRPPRFWSQARQQTL